DSATPVCELSANETRNNDKEEDLPIMDEMPFLGLIPRQTLSDYEESSVIQEVREELESLENPASLKPPHDPFGCVVTGYNSNHLSTTGCAELLFPVCTPLPEEGEPCHDPSNRLLNLITWELEPDGALVRCPCASGLICQPQSNSATPVCELSANETRNNEKEEDLPIMDEMPFLGLIPRQTLSDYEESSVIQEVREELESLENPASLKPPHDPFG
ncbi:PREDICTED: dickkopf-related protein 3-like, partial [Calidris pugnax]|uniref:dickkopf-related protein 3-like n=1 Tax=Calidris pugnax TaxID=198806 RepID=UPI00071CC0B5